MNTYNDILEQLKNESTNSPFRQKSAYWRRYDDTVASMSAEQRSWVSKQQDVIDAKNTMLTVFFDYLFDVHKEAFVSVGDGQYKAVVDEYINTIQKSADGYVSRAETLEKENEELRKQLKQLLDKETRHGKSMATNGAGHGGESINDSPVRTGDPAQINSGDLPLFED